MRGNHVRVVDRWQADTFDVFVFDGPVLEAASPSTMHRHVEGDVWRTEEVGETDPYTGLPKPSFSVPREVMEAMLAQSKKLVPSLDRDDAVADARKVRDRLLAMVELAAVGR